MTSMLSNTSSLLNNNNKMDNNIQQEYGRIVVFSKEGNESSHFTLSTNSTSIGREKESDIRIKVSNVSRLHAKIVVDENGAVSIINYSKTQIQQLLIIILN